MTERASANRPVRQVSAEAGRFGLVGLACAALNVGIVHVGHDHLGWPYLLAALATCGVTIPLSYLAHARFSFRASHGAGTARFLRFLAQQSVQFGLGLAALAAFVEVIGMPPTLAMVAVTGLMFVFGFVSNASWVFRVLGSR